MTDEYLIHVDSIRAGYVPGVDILDGCSLELRKVQPRPPAEPTTTNSAAID